MIRLAPICEGKTLSNYGRFCISQFGSYHSLQYYRSECHLFLLDRISILSKYMFLEFSARLMSVVKRGLKAGLHDSQFWSFVFFFSFTIFEKLKFVDKLVRWFAVLLKLLAVARNGHI